MGAITGLSNYSRLDPIAPLDGSPFSGMPGTPRGLSFSNWAVCFRYNPAQKASPSHQ
ncbi:MAG: hypothetical protein HOE10_06050 [Deltaproteobacteria bacterium]|nr:hypothetical protein [Deltaproteobacteria bacterium]